jgi:hypothetical protein
VNTFDEFLDRYGPVPKGHDVETAVVLFATEVFGLVLDPWQERVLRAYARGERRISIRACHGPGKTFIASVIIWHQMICRFPQHTVVTAPSRGQLEDALVKEVMTQFTKLPEPIRALFDVKKNRIELKNAPDESFFSARTARAENPEALQGVHCDLGWVLLIADEASGVHEKIFEAAAGSMSGHRATTLLLSNPVRSSGFFFDTHTKLRDMWFTVHVSHKDSERVSDDFVEDMRRRYGDNSNQYRVRALGEFPTSDLDTVIPFELASAATQREIFVPPKSPTVWSLDVARFGDDWNVLMKRNRIAVSPLIKKWQGVDLMKTAGRVKAEWDETPLDERPSVILIDVIGLGAGVVDRLMELGLPVRGINVSEAASFTGKYRNLRTELWFLGREWLEGRGTLLPVCDGTCRDTRECIHDQLVNELTLVKYDYTSTGKLMVESKKDIKKRGYPSPNVAEAFILSFAEEPAGLLGGPGNTDGWGGTAGWNSPITRGLGNLV